MTSWAIHPGFLSNTDGKVSAEPAAIRSDQTVGPSLAVQTDAIAFFYGSHSLFSVLRADSASFSARARDSVLGHYFLPL